MKLIRVFIAVVVISLIIGVGGAFSGKRTSNSPRNVDIVVEQDTTPDEELDKSNDFEVHDNDLEEEQNDFVEEHSSNQVIEIVDVPSVSTQTNENTSNNNRENVISDNHKSEEKSNSFFSASDTKEKTVQQESSNSVQTPSVDNSVDTSSFDYDTHKGRIDCYSSEDCMNKSLPLQFKFKSIANSFYVEVMANSGISLGYFIEYVFRDYNFSSVEECESIGSEIKQALPDRVSGYECSGSTLKIKTDY